MSGRGRGARLIDTLPTLEVVDLKTHFFTKAGVVRAVDGVSLSRCARRGAGPRRRVGLRQVGDRLLDPRPHRSAGPHRLGRASRSPDATWRDCPRSELRALRGSRIAMIFQDPMMTLNPVLRVDTQMIEAILAHRRMRPRRGARARPRRAGPGRHPAPERRLKSYPHELSGGMRQRVAIAIAFLNKPDLVIADEPTTALDVTIQAQILHEAQELCRKTGTAMIWISHDLAVVSSLADRVAVMYAGVIVEQGRASDVIRAPLHPYTRGLLGSVPSGQRARHPPRPDPRHDALADQPGRPAAASAPAASAPASECASEPAITEPLAPAARCAAGGRTSKGRCRDRRSRARPSSRRVGLTKRFVKDADLAEAPRHWLGAGAAARSCTPSTASA